MNPKELETQWNLENSVWHTVGALMQQGTDFCPVSLSLRFLVGIFYFFTLILLASYTANLAASLTSETLLKPIENAKGGSPKINYVTKCLQLILIKSQTLIGKYVSIYLRAPSGPRQSDNNQVRRGLLRLYLQLLQGLQVRHLQDHVVLHDGPQE